LTITLIYTEPLAIYQSQDGFCYPNTGFWRHFWPWVSISVSCDSLVYLSLQFGGSSLPCDLTYLMIIPGVVDLSYYSAFCLLFGWRKTFKFLIFLTKPQKSLVFFICIFLMANEFEPLFLF
jgi:hypothetical protein